MGRTDLSPIYQAMLDASEGLSVSRRRGPSKLQGSGKTKVRDTFAQRSSILAEENQGRIRRKESGMTCGETVKWARPLAECSAMTTDRFAVAPWTVQPIFVSSTFRDMQAERDHLRQFVFPRLEEELRRSRLQLEPIDLRQGVETAQLPSEEAREALVLKVCLDEIERSRPFLIVLLGDRYGWVPPEERLAAATQEAGFVTEFRDKSVTALEIEFGILMRSPERRRRCFFYFREPLPYDRMPPHVAAVYSDEYANNPATRQSHAHLVRLKQTLADDPELAPRVHAYRASWDTATARVIGLEPWGETVFENLLQELQSEICAAASGPPQNWQDQERAALSEFTDHRRRDFTGRQQLLESLMDLAISPTPAEAVFAIPEGMTWGACLSGDSGSGKSAVFAELAARLVAKNEAVLLANAAGATPRGSQVEAMLERFIDELAGVLGISNPLPESASSDELDATFASLLGRAAAQCRVVVLLDALDQFDPTPRAQHLTWLRPKMWPANARLIATSLPSLPAEALSQWAGIEELDVPPLAVTGDGSDDVASIAGRIAKRYHRQVNPAVLRVLREKRLANGESAAANPLWVTLALEQLNLLDADDFNRAERDFSGTPAERLQAMMVDTAERMPPSVTELYGWLLAYAEKVHGPAAARSFAAVIAVSRFGWRDTDLLSLIPAAARLLCPDEPVPTLDDLRLAALRRGFRAHLTRRGGLGQLDFSHLQMREAIQRRSLSHHSQVRALHAAIADHLETMPADDRLRTSELMMHAISADDCSRAAHLYADLPDDSPALTAATQTLTQFAILGDAAAADSSIAWVAALFEQPSLTNQQLYKLADQFNSGIDRLLGDKADLSTRQILLQATRAALLRLTESEPLHMAWLYELGVTIDRLGGLARAQGNLSDAEQLFRESLTIAQRLAKSDPANGEWQRELSVTLNKLGELAAWRGDLLEVQRLFSESLRIRHRLVESDPGNRFWRGDLAVSLFKQGELATALGSLSEARRLFEEALRIRRDLAEFNPDSAQWQRDVSLALGKLGELVVMQGNLTDAQQHFSESIRILQRLAESDPGNFTWRRELAMSFDRLGGVAASSGSLQEAQQRFDDALRIRQELCSSDPGNANWQHELCLSLNNVGELAASQENLPESLRLFNEVRRILQHLVASDPTNGLWQHDLATVCGRLGQLATAHGNLSNAGQLLHESHAILERLADANNTAWQRDLSVSFGRLGELSASQGRWPEAQRLFGESLRIAQQLAESDPTNVMWQHDLASSLARAGELATVRRDLPEALSLMHRALAIGQRLVESQPENHRWQRVLWASYWRVAVVLEQLGSDEALAYWRRAHDVVARLIAVGASTSPRDQQLLAELRRRVERGHPSENDLV